MNKMVIREQCYLLTLIVHCIFHSAVFIQGTDVKAFDDTVLFKINWPGKSGSDLLVSICFFRMCYMERNFKSVSIIVLLMPHWLSGQRV